VEGSELYLALGCGVCHPLVERGLGGWDFGPDLTAIGRKSLQYLKTSLLDPTDNFEGSTMPSFRLALGNDESSMTNLLIYLESLVLARYTCTDRWKSAGLVDPPCVRCHDGNDGAAAGRFKHACSYILERKEQIGCSGCHKGSIPSAGPGGGFCPAISPHRSACSACHEQAGRL
jgi:hypothetical protein